MKMGDISIFLFPMHGRTVGDSANKYIKGNLSCRVQIYCRNIRIALANESLTNH